MNEHDMSQFAAIDGDVTVEVTAYQHGDQRYATRDESGAVLQENPGMTVREFRALYGGEETFMTDAFKRGRHLVSLKGLQIGDPDQTRLLIRFRFRPRR